MNLNETITKIIEDRKAAYREHRMKISERAVFLNAGWAASKASREGFSHISEPTWGKDNRPHAPFDGYLWEDPRTGEVECYGGGQYLPFTDEFDDLNKPEFTKEFGFWKLRLTQEMYDEIFEIDSLQFRIPYKRWTMDETEVLMVEIRASKTILNAIKEYSEDWFNAYYEAKKSEKGIAPEGRQEVTAVVVSVKSWFDTYGPVTKMLVKFENGSTAYGSLPKAVPHDHRGEIKFVATFQQALGDKTHSFFKRPSKVTVC